ncbi:MAG: Fic family protein [Paludibacteraceae bacterium]|nr:Fic family protein [Paludibacteraceae bacterium]
MKELPTYQPDFEEYIRQGEPGKKERAQIWRTAIGLQQVDGLETSDYLKQTVRRNIEGEISIDEVQRLVKEYYVSKTNHEPDDDDKQEADLVTGNIGKILSTKTLDFSTNGYVSLHRRIFAGVFKHAGQIRDYDFTKSEFVLRGDTVSYLNCEDLRRALDYEIDKEKQFDYSGLSSDEMIEHIAKFVSDIWQIHAFKEGNTRTTAVFAIQYLRSVGYKVNNDMFAAHSWYFRNALVRANYKNAVQGINYESIYLERFFRNLLLGEQWDLRSRYLVINPPAEYAVQPRMDSGSVTENVTENPRNVTENVIENLSERQQKIIRLVKEYPFATTGIMADRLNVSVMTIRRDMEKMSHLIRHVGPDKGGHWEIQKE